MMSLAQRGTTPESHRIAISSSVSNDSNLSGSCCIQTASDMYLVRETRRMRTCQSYAVAATKHLHMRIA